MTTNEWLSMAYAIDALTTREEREAHQRAVREAISTTEQLVLWNCRACNWLDVACFEVGQ